MPFDFVVEEGSVCGACFAHPPTYTRARSAMIYDAASRDLVLALKHGDRLHPVPALAAWMGRAGHDLLEKSDFLVPIPLHPTRLWVRRYNQAALLALQLSQKTGKIALLDGLIRTRKTPSQGHLGRKEREKNVKNAFVANPKRKTILTNKRIVLVDDVLTTGATVNAAASALLDAGALEVFVLTLARTRHDQI